MNPASPAFEIVIFCEPGTAGFAAKTAPDRFDSPVARALGCLPGGVGLELTHDPNQTAELCGRRAIDLIVADRVSVEHASSLLRALGPAGPPLVLLSEDAAGAASLEALRPNDAGILCAGPDLAAALPGLALAQMRGSGRNPSLNDAIVEEIPAALFVVDARQRILRVNPECSRALQVDAEAAIGKPFDQVLPRQLVETGELGELLAASQAGLPPKPRLARCCDADGTLRFFDVRARALGHSDRVLVVLSDVTERETLVRRIGDLQRYNENIIQNMNSALLVIDSDARITFANATAEAILGAEPGSLRDRIAWEWFDAARRDGTLLTRTLEEGLRFKGAETVISREDGRKIPVGISCAPLVDGNGSKLGAVAIFQDLSEIVELQRQVLQNEKMASIGQLAAGVAHEVNNPMGFIHANLFQMSEYLQDLRRVWEAVESLDKAASSGTVDEARAAAHAFESLSEELDIDFVMRDFSKAVRESQEGSERIRHIVQDLRDFSYQDTAERTLADVNQCVDSTASIVWTMMKHAARLKKQYSDLPQISCFPMQLKQVFMNLLVNAYQAIEARFGDSGEIGEISILTARQGDGVVVTIADTGIGIPPEDLDRIFVPFFTTKEVGVGTGLGLSTSYSIVKRHGGRIRVESEPGRGSRFELWLPIDPEQAVIPELDPAGGR